ncbi:MAG: hypothetical protein ACOY3X_00800 [Pseudomonadota bacterium]
MRTASTVLPTLAAILVATACSNPSPMASPENMALGACETILDKDGMAFEKLTITEADFILQEQGLKFPVAQRQSYAGSVLKPEQLTAQRHEFERAARELAGVSCKAAVPRGSEIRERMDGGNLEVLLYAIVSDGKPVESPLFEVVNWGGENRYRLLGLRFGDERFVRATHTGEPGGQEPAEEAYLEEAGPEEALSGEPDGGDMSAEEPLPEDTGGSLESQDAP